MRLGDIVRNRKNGEYGTVEYSTFGYSIHTVDEERNIFGKTAGYPARELEEYWEVVEMPKGYKVHKYGGIVKIKKED